MSEQPNCTVPTGALNASSDIVGPGVVSAFFATASITIIAVIIAYLSDSLDDGDFINDLDRMVIRWAMRTYRKSWAPVRPKPDPTADQTSNKSGSSRAWKRTIQEFILALSDQQLVTGLSILIAGISNQNDMVGYEYTIMTCLAWFSSTTHLATMDALRTYLKGCGAVRDIRAAGIIAVVFLLLYAFVITANVAVHNDLRRIPVPCLFKDEYTSYKSKLPLVAWILVSVLIVWGYVTRLADLYKGAVRTAILKLFKCTNQERTGQSPASRGADLSGSPSSPATLERRVGVQQNPPEDVNSSPSFLRVILKGARAYNTSFLSSLSTITFSFSYGIAQLSLYRWRLAPDLTSDANHMGFGQLMPLFLLALPFLTAMETFYGYKKKRSFEVDHGTQSSEPCGCPKPSESPSQDEGFPGSSQDNMNTTQTSDEDRGPQRRPISLDNEQDMARNSSSEPQRICNPNSPEGSSDSATVGFHTNELKFGLILFFLSLVRSILLGVFLNGAAMTDDDMTNDKILYTAIAIFIVSFAYKVTKVLPYQAEQILLSYESKIMDIVRGKGKGVRTESNGIELPCVSEPDVNRQRSRTSTENLLA